METYCGSFTYWIGFRSGHLAGVMIRPAGIQATGHKLVASVTCTPYWMSCLALLSIWPLSGGEVSQQQDQDHSRRCVHAGRVWLLPITMVPNTSHSELRRHRHTWLYILDVSPWRRHQVYRIHPFLSGPSTKRTGLSIYRTITRWAKSPVFQRFGVVVLTLLISLYKDTCANTCWLSDHSRLPFSIGGQKQQ